MEWYKNKRFFRLSFLMVSIVLIIYFLFILRDILFPFILGFIIAYFLNPMVVVLEKRKISRVTAISIVYLAVLSSISVIGFFGFPKMIAELNQFADEIPKFTIMVQQVIENLQQQYTRFTLPESLRHVMDERIAKGEEVILNIVTHTVNSILNIFTHVFSFFLAPIVSFYLLKDRDKIKNWVSSTTPTAYRSDIMGLLRDIDTVIFEFIKGNLLVGTFVGLLIGIGMHIIGVPFAGIIGVIAGITNLIPFIGPFIGAIPAVFLALLESKLTAIYALLLIFIVQQVEGNILTPKILGNNVGLHPLWIIFALLAGGQLMGVIGMIIAVPVAAIAKVIIRYIFLKLVS